MRLVTGEGRWATKDNSMIFGNIVYLCGPEDISLYHLIDSDGNEMRVDITDFLEE